MATYYLDTSAVVKRYVQEIGTTWVRSLLAPAAGNFLFISRITAVELTAALALRRRQASLTSVQSVTALYQIRQDFALDYLVIEASASLLSRAEPLADQYVLRAYDAIQLASALEVRSRESTLVLISSDIELNAAAAAEGLAVDDPNAHP